MRIDAWEKLDDGFVNMFENGAFISAIEYLALIVSEVLGYKLVPDIDKKNWFVYLKVSFPKNLKDIKFEKIINMGYAIRFKDKNFNIEFIGTGTKKIEKDKQKLIGLKKDFIKFE